MRMRLLARRSAPVIHPGPLPEAFEFAHLLDAVSMVGMDVAPRAAAEVACAVDPAVDPDVVPDTAPDAGPDVVSYVSDDWPDAQADSVPVVVVSRFADAGLDDDRLPVVVKRRRGRRR